MVNSGASTKLVAAPAVAREKSTSALSQGCNKEPPSAAEAAATASTPAQGSAASPSNSGGERPTLGACAALSPKTDGVRRLAAITASAEAFVGTAATAVAVARRAAVTRPVIPTPRHAAAAAAAGENQNVYRPNDVFGCRCGFVSYAASKQWQRGSLLRTVHLLHLITFCTIGDMPFVDASAAASNACRAPTRCTAITAVGCSPAIAAVRWTHATAAEVATGFPPPAGRRRPNRNGTPKCVGDQQLHTRDGVYRCMDACGCVDVGVSQRSLHALQQTVLPLPDKDYTSTGEGCTPPVSTPNIESIVPEGAQTAAAVASAAGGNWQSCRSNVPTFGNRRPRRGLPGQARRGTGSNGLGRKRQQFVDLRVRQLPQTRGPPLSWLLLLQPLSVAAEAYHAMCRNHTGLCGCAHYSCGMHKPIGHDRTAPYTYRRWVCSSPPSLSVYRSTSGRGTGMVLSSPFVLTLYSNARGSDRTISGGDGGSSSRCYVSVGSEDWRGCSRTSNSDTSCSATSSTGGRRGYGISTFIKSIACENNCDGCNREASVRSGGRDSRNHLLVHPQQVGQGRHVYSPSRLQAKRPRAKAEKRARNYQRAYEEQRRREQQQLKKQQQEQRQLLERQEEAERQRAQQRRLSGKAEETEEGGSAAGGSATLTQLMEEARVAAGEVVKHPENFVVVGSTQRRVHGRRPPNIQRYENQQEFVKSVFKEFPVTEQELQTEILKAERAWRGDMMLDELEAEIGGPDALAPGGVGMPAR